MIELFIVGTFAVAYMMGKWNEQARCRRMMKVRRKGEVARYEGQ